ncbi:proteophosphoglycan ppg4 [Strigomonas culicis]|uniref:Proteophosphoglycan ppg4 n=1 Tax=Strigomonas culicis TaxID=28005 RepID=S9V627_9TRYP|nr:proteophosphoglycan ppg4 [Strigomonas culicis]|eukprot:EPY18365.1 proteophosphoglycan ppg4 [Strigomonas culicis]
MSFFGVDGAMDIYGLAAECQWAGNSHRSAYTDSSSSSSTSSSADAVQPAGEPRPPSPGCDGVQRLVQPMPDGLRHSSDPPEAESPSELPVGALTPRKAAALRQERLALAAADGASPPVLCRPTERAPPMSGGGARLSSLTFRKANMRVVGASGRTPPRPLVDSSWNYSFGANSTFGRPERGGASTSTGETASGTSGGDGVAVSPSGSVPLISISGPSGDTSAGEAGAARPLPSPPTENLFTAEEASCPASLCSRNMNYNMGSMYSTGGDTATWRRGLASESEHQPDLPSALPSFAYSGAGSQFGYNFRRPSLASRSLLYDLQSLTSFNAPPSMLRTETTAVPAPEEEEAEGDAGGSVALFADYCTDDQAGADCADPSADEGSGGQRVDRTAVKQEVPLICDMAGEHQLRRTQSLMPEVLASVTKGARRATEPGLIEDEAVVRNPTAPHAMPCARSSFGWGAAQEHEKEAEDEPLGWDDIRADSTDSDGDGAETHEAVCKKETPLSTSGGLSGGLPSDERLLPEGSEPPNWLRIPGHSRPLWMRPERGPPPAPAVMLEAAPSVEAECTSSPTDTSDTSTASVEPLTALGRRYRCPQPLPFGPALPLRQRVDPRRLFGGNCLGAAPWVRSPRDLDVDPYVPVAPTSAAAQIADYVFRGSAPPAVHIPDEVPVSSASPKVDKEEDVLCVPLVSSSPDREEATQPDEPMERSDNHEQLHEHGYPTKKKKKGNIIRYFRRRK